LTMITSEVMQISNVSSLTALVGSPLFFYKTIINFRHNSKNCFYFLPLA
jgi:hypothetical protein